MPRGTDRYDEARRQGRLWTPAVEAASLYSWLDASSLASLTFTTGLISSWKDQSGRGANASAVASPDYATLQTNPLAVYSGNATSQSLEIAGLASSTYDLLIVAKPNAPGGWRTLVWNSSNHHPVLIEGGSTRLGSYTGGFIQAGSLTWPNQVGLGYVSVRASGDIQMSRDGGDLVALSGESLTLSTTMLLLNTSSGGGQGWGAAHELIFLPVSSTTRPPLKEKCEGYAAWKWQALGAGDLIGNLAASHPFKNRPPLIGD
jgi:hypothetical protein